MKIADHTIGPDAPVFLVAELGITALGSVDRAKMLVDAVAYAGCDAAKFIVTDPNKTMRGPGPAFTYARHLTYGEHAFDSNLTRPLYDLLVECVLAPDEWRAIRDYCHEKGVVFFATTDHLDGLDLLESLDVPAHKISAWDIAFTPLLAAMRATGKPVLVDVGTVTREELLRALPDENNILYVHDPHPPDWNLSRLVGAFEPGCPADYFRFRPDYAVGFSSPNREDWCDYVALGAGACLIEKRLTLRRDEVRGHHHAISLEPEEFRAWVTAMRRVDALRKDEPFGGSPQAWVDRQRYTRGEDGRFA